MLSDLAPVSKDIAKASAEVAAALERVGIPLSPADHDRVVELARGFADAALRLRRPYPFGLAPVEGAASGRPEGADRG